MLANGLAYAGKQIEVRLPCLKRGQGALFLLQTYGLTLGLWQALDYPEKLRSILNEPEFRPLVRRFNTELEAAVGAFWIGTFLGNKHAKS